MVDLVEMKEIYFLLFRVKVARAIGEHTHAQRTKKDQTSERKKYKRNSLVCVLVVFLICVKASIFFAVSAYCF